MRLEVLISTVPQKTRVLDPVDHAGNDELGAISSNERTGYPVTSDAVVPEAKSALRTP